MNCVEICPTLAATGTRFNAVQSDELKYYLSTLTATLGRAHIDPQVLAQPPS
jgi:formate hydrogenlyase subunit 6/NADH:ubiquinone oxidoreductase subunit I